MTRDPKDFYETPEKATYPIMVECIMSGVADLWEVVLDLGCGDGRLGLSAKAAYNFSRSESMLSEGVAQGIELDEERAHKATLNGVDYVYNMALSDVGEVTPPDLVIANPPFSMALDFLVWAAGLRAESGADVLFLLPLGYMASQGRHPFWKLNPPDALRVHSSRLSFTGDGKTANADYGWFYWGGGLRGIDFYP